MHNQRNMLHCRPRPKMDKAANPEQVILMNDKDFDDF